MIAVDTNVLVQAHRPDADRHEHAREALTELASGTSPWAVPWPCVNEFLGVVTHRRIFSPPTRSDEALAAIRAVVEQAGAVLLGEGADHLDRMGDLLATSGATGPKVHDARIAAICLSHGITELWTADRDFSSFPALRTRNPLVPRRS